MPDLTPAANRWLRGTAALLAAVLAGASFLAAGLWSGSHTPSAGVLTAAVLSGLAAAACLALALGPQRWLTPIVCTWTRLQAQQPTDANLFSQREARWLVIIGAANYGLIVARLLSLPQNPWDDDQGAFLITAQEIHDQGGIAGFWTALWSGSFAEANRHPLYLALLSLNPTVRGGAILSAVIGAVTFVVFVAGAARRFGWGIAAVFAVLLGTNGAFCLFSTRIVCEILLMLWCGLTWLVHVPPATAPGAPAISPRHCALGGALLGLAWLTKGTGLVFFAGYLAWIVITSLRTIRQDAARHEAHGSRIIALRTAGMPVLFALAAFLAVGSPLIARNVQRFGNPFHNLNSLLLFADRYEDLAAMVEQDLTTGAAAQHFLRSHSVGDIARREASGLIWEAFIIARSLGPAPLDDARVLFGLPIALLAGLGMALRRGAADGLLLIWGALCWGLFAWYVPIAAGERFILPLVGPVLISAATTICRLAVSRERPLNRVFVGVSVVWSIVWVLACWLTSGFVDQNG